VKITKVTHARVRVEHEGRVLVVDPGIRSEPCARGWFAGATDHGYRHLRPFGQAAGPRCGKTATPKRVPGP
jgi:hypothetical protein